MLKRCEAQVQGTNTSSFSLGHSRASWKIPGKPVIRAPHSAHGSGVTVTDEEQSAVDSEAADADLQ
jgi:hypothetical protein